MMKGDDEVTRDPSGRERSGSGEPDRLDPAADPGRWERAVSGIVDAAGPELRRRAEARRAWPREVQRWARPLLAAAAALILVSTVSLLLETGDGSSPLPAPTFELESALYPAEVEPWLRGDRQPLVEEVVFAGTSAASRP